MWAIFDFPTISVHFPPFLSESGFAGLWDFRGVWGLNSRSLAGGLCLRVGTGIRVGRRHKAWQWGSVFIYMDGEDGGCLHRDYGIFRIGAAPEDPIIRRVLIQTVGAKGDIGVVRGSAAGLSESASLRAPAGDGAVPHHPAGVVPRPALTEANSPADSVAQPS